MRTTTRVLLGLALSLLARIGLASDLSYTFLDFQAVQQSVEASGTQIPAPGQSVDVVTDEGDGVAVQGSVALGERFYVIGSFSTSIVDVSGVVTSSALPPPGFEEVTDNFDLLMGTLGVGYIQPFGDNFDVIAQISFDSAEMDFGSFAGENFDTSDTGVGGSVGFRWNPVPQFEIHSAAHYTSVGDPLLPTREFDSDTRFGVGLRWYFIKDLALGLDYVAGQIDTVTVSMRFSFGKLAW